MASPLTPETTAEYREKLRKLKSMKGVFRFQTHEEADLWMEEWRRRLDLQSRKKTGETGEKPPKS
ncbi:MAG TPA: hypothetical protein DCK99_23025 [Blastocatellia bacterium]|nr:hypothetical protein [Blastocatellia bacterium]